MFEEMPTITDRLPVRRQRRPGGDSHLIQQRGPPLGLAGLTATCLGTVICDTTSQGHAVGRSCSAHSGTELGFRSSPLSPVFRAGAQGRGSCHKHIERVLTPRKTRMRLGHA